MNQLAELPGLARVNSQFTTPGAIGIGCGERSEIVCADDMF